MFNIKCRGRHHLNRLERSAGLLQLIRECYCFSLVAYRFAPLKVKAEDLEPIAHGPLKVKQRTLTHCFRGQVVEVEGQRDETHWDRLPLLPGTPVVQLPVRQTANFLTPPRTLRRAESPFRLAVALLDPPQRQRLLELVLLLAPLAAAAARLLLPLDVASSFHLRFPLPPLRGRLCPYLGSDGEPSLVDPVGKRSLPCRRGTHRWGLPGSGRACLSRRDYTSDAALWGTSPL